MNNYHKLVSLYEEVVSFKKETHINIYEGYDNLYTAIYKTKFKELIQIKSEKNAYKVDKDYKLFVYFKLCYFVIYCNTARLYISSYCGGPTKEEHLKYNEFENYIIEKNLLSNLMKFQYSYYSLLVKYNEFVFNFENGVTSLLKGSIFKNESNYRKNCDLYFNEDDLLCCEVYSSDSGGKNKCLIFEDNIRDIGYNHSHRSYLIMEQLKNWFYKT